MSKKWILWLAVSMWLGGCNTAIFPYRIEEINSDINEPVQTVSHEFPTQSFTSVPLITETAKSKECIGNFEEFAFEVVENYEEYPDLGFIYPMHPWEYIVELPEEDAIMYGIVSAVEYNDVLEIWIRKISGFPLNAGSQEYIIYYPSTNEMVTIPSEISETGFWADSLNFAEDGTIWARINWNPRENYSYDEIPIFSKYNRETHQFEFDNNAYRIPVVLNDPEYEGWIQYLYSGTNEIWFFVPYDGLYIYDYLMGNTIKRLNIPDFKVETSTFALDGNIYFTLPRQNQKEKFTNIYQYSPQSDKKELITEVEYASIGGLNLLLDHRYQLWLGSVSTVDSLGNQKILHPNFDLYKEKRYSPKSGYWLAPGILTESSNGYLWFNKSRYTDSGTAWYDPKTDDSCWFTTFSGTVVEDNNQQMWFLAGKKLYKYKLE